MSWKIDMISYRVAIKSSVDPMPAFVFFSVLIHSFEEASYNMHTRRILTRAQLNLPGNLFNLFLARGLFRKISTEREREREYKIVTFRREENNIFYG